MDFLRKPYPADSFRKNLTMSVLIGFFVMFFLFYFQPFGLSTLSFQQSLWVSAGFGLVTMVICPAFFLISRYFFPTFFEENCWTTRKEIMMIIANFCLIGIGNFLFAYGIGITRFDITGFIFMLFSTVLIGIFPITFFVLLNQVRLLKRNLALAEGLNFQLKSQQKNSQVSNVDSKITLTAENGKDELAFSKSALLLIESTGNYVTIYLANGDKKPTKKLLRSSLSRIENFFAGKPEVFRCHRAYLVNLSHLKEVNGNSQGYKLHIKGIQKLVPVARSQSKLLREQLQFLNAL